MQSQRTLIAFITSFSALAAAASLCCAEDVSLAVPGNIAWTNTGLRVRPGLVLNIRSTGSVRFKERTPKDRSVNEVFPQGTFLFTDDEIGQSFPLPAAGAGPASVGCLIGKVGETGDPFYVGADLSTVITENGLLYLGINDFRLDDNLGEFQSIVTVRADAGSLEGIVAQPVSQSDSTTESTTASRENLPLTNESQLRPVAMRQRVPSSVEAGQPVAGSRVVLFYVDGLRPDIVYEMAAMGHLPNIAEYFLRKGTHLSNALTVFPSDTITSNGSLWTGVFSDRHGIKAQIGFNRRLQKSENYLQRFGPVLNDLMLNPSGIDKAILETGSSLSRAVGGSEAAENYRRLRTTQTPTLAAHLENAGRTFSAGAMPIMGALSPDMWTRYLADEIPYLSTHRSDRFIDETNSSYTMRHLFNKHSDVTVVWLPENDTVSHHEYRGQFGMARRALSEADAQIGAMIDRLKNLGEFDRTYLVLISDHGHHGGRFEHLNRFDLANEVFHHSREVDVRGMRTGGGLGMTVRMDRYTNATKGDLPRDFVFIDALGTGVARVFLPKDGFGTGDWSGPSPVGRLLKYHIRGTQAVNLFTELSSATAYNEMEGQLEHPVDLVLARAGRNAVLIHHRMRGWGLIERQTGYDGRLRYRYRVIHNPRGGSRGELIYEKVRQPKIDPLLLAGRISPDLLDAWHTEDDWLKITFGTLYPDSVVSMTRHLLWQPELNLMAAEQAPDLVVTAAPGWQFNTFNEPGTAHGHPFHETMRMSFFVSGPNVRHGASLQKPVRAVDLTPTLLDMVGVDVSRLNLDGKPIRELYATDQDANSVVSFPLYWHDVDLQAWSAIPFDPRPIYPHQPRTVNRPQSFWDFSNLTYNVLSVGEISINRVLNDSAKFSAFRLLRLRQRPLDKFREQTRETLDPATGEVPDLQLHKLSFTDYSWYSQANLSRAFWLARWTNRKASEVDKAIADPLGQETALGTPITEKLIDITEYSAWEIRRFGTRVGARIMDRWVLQQLEDSADALLNIGNAQPAEVETR